MTDDKKKTKNSTFLLTINTNKSKDIDKDRFEKSIYNLFTEQNIKPLLKFFEGDFNDIKNIETRVGIETGPRYGKIHSHIAISIEHKAKIHIDIAKIKQYIKINMKIPEDIHVNIKSQRGSFQSFINYVTKYSNIIRDDI